MPKDACYNQVKARYSSFPSARASQAIAKCRKSKGQVRKSKEGASLKRWQREKWKDTRTGKPCGAATRGSQYCRPTRKVSRQTPRTSSEMSKADRKAGQAAKSSGRRAPANPIKRRKSKYKV